MTNPHGQFEWKRRRRIIYLTLAFCAAVIGWLVLFGADTALNNTIVTVLVVLAGSVIGSYVFGAVWDDANARKYGGGLGDGP